jgi:glycosyltransferase involved in cell wall biosynthesis
LEPIVLIASGIKNEAKTLPAFFEQIDNLDYPKDRLRYALYTSPSTDNTLDLVYQWLKDKPDAWWHNMTINLTLRKRMYLQGNYMRHYATLKQPDIEPIEYIFHCDADIIEIPPETLKLLIGLDLDIVAPYVYVSDEHHPLNKFRGLKIFRDVWGYRFKHGPHPGLQFNPSVMGYYKRNIDRDKSIQADMVKRVIPKQSVGANPVLYRASLYDKVQYDGLYAFPGWCLELDKAGYGVWCYPELECVHDWRQ